jgi:hypothetical protein
MDIVLLLGDAHERKTLRGFRFSALHGREPFSSFLARLREGDRANTDSEYTQAAPTNGVGAAAFRVSELRSKNRPVSPAWRGRLLSMKVLLT